MRNITHYSNLILQMLLRDTSAKYRGSLLGFAWIFATPILLLGVFTLIFNGVFSLKWPQSEHDSTQAFAVITFCGLLFHLMFAETLTRSSTLILENVNLVKKVLFPLWILPLVVTLSSGIQWFISLSLAMLASMIIFEPNTTMWWLPFWVIPFTLTVLGLSLLFSALGVFIRDLPQTLGLLMTLLMFLSPIFYPLSSVDPVIGYWLALNPVAVTMEGARALIIEGNIPALNDWIYVSSWGIGALLLGTWVFTKLSKHFSDVM